MDFKTRQDAAKKAFRNKLIVGGLLGVVAIGTIGGTYSYMHQGDSDKIEDVSVAGDDLSKALSTKSLKAGYQPVEKSTLEEKRVDKKEDKKENKDSREKEAAIEQTVESRVQEGLKTATTGILKDADAKIKEAQKETDDMRNERDTMKSQLQKRVDEIDTLKREMQSREAQLQAQIEDLKSELAQRRIGNTVSKSEVDVIEKTEAEQRALDKLGNGE